MYSALQYAIKKPSAEKNDHVDHEAPKTGGAESDAAAGINATVSTPKTEPKKAEVKNKKKVDLSPEETAERKRRRSYRWKTIIGLLGTFSL